MGAAGKRAHKPRVRGCYQCSRRRIDCDRTDPACLKCTARQLPCSGYGKRYRFADDLFAVGKAPGGLRFRIDKLCRSRQESDKADAGPTSPLGSGCFDGTRRPTTTYGKSRSPTELADTRRLNHRFSDPQIEESCTCNSEQGCTDDSTRSSPTLVDAEETPSSVICTELEIFDPWTEYLFKCFSENIAPKLVTYDDQLNGWRRLVLPMAHQDKLVRDAIVSTSTFFFALFVTQGLYNINPEYTYQRVLHGLRRRQDLTAQSKVERQGVIVSLLLLWATIMVNGFSDFRAVHRLIEGAWSTNQRESLVQDGELDTFLTRQVEKIRGYAAPFLSQEEGIAVLCQTKAPMPSTSKGWDEFRSYCESYANLSDSMSAIYALHVQACKIYLARAQTVLEQSTIQALIADYRTNLDSLAPDCPGRHLLVWPTFIVAMECKTIDLQEYFTSALLAQYRHLGFANVLKALEYLATFWANQESDDWTKFCTHFDVFIF